MDTTTIITLIASGVILIVLGGFIGVWLIRRQRSNRLKETFGPEYERTVDEVGDRQEAEEELHARIKHKESLEIEPLSQAQQERFAREWQRTQAKFVDQPEAAIRDADRLIKEIMQAKGYPAEDFEQRAADLSVEYPELVENYRNLREIMDQDEDYTTEDMRQAMIHCRNLYEELLNTEVDDEDYDEARMEEEDQDENEEEKEGLLEKLS